MTLEQIKAAMKERKMEAPDLAKELGVNVNSLRQILAGQRTLTEQLSRHIAHVLGKSECIFVYRVTVADAKVEELTAGRGCTSEKERLEAMKQIVEHNMLELARLGASLDWTPQQREAWGLDPIPGSGDLEAAEEMMPGPSEMPVPYIPAARGPSGPMC